MNKSELIAHVADATGMPKDQAERAVNAVVVAIQDTLVAGGEVTLIGFGSFLVTDRAAKTGRNPRTGEVIHIPPTRVPSFKAGQTLKKAVAK
ncbi:MAG: HU family DNA-binding protein [Magnetococcus sp. YQC-3]